MINSSNVLYDIDSPIDNGLYNGTLGLSLINYITYKNTKNEKYNRLAKKKLNETVNNITYTNSYTFYNGLLGFGWALEWLVQGSFIKINTDDYLEELDDEVYKLIVYTNNHDINLDKGLLGLILYLYKRLCSNKTSKNFYRRVCLVECLSLTIERLSEQLSNKSSEIRNIAKTLVLLCKVRRLRINLDVVESSICRIVEIINKRYYKDPLVGYTNEDLQLLLAWRYAGEEISCDEWLFKSNTKYSELKSIVGKHLVDTDSETYKMLIHLDRNNKYNWKEGWLLS